MNSSPVGEAAGQAARRAADPQKFAVTVGPSEIDGLGVFAAEAIPARWKIGEIRGEPVGTAEAFKRARAAESEGGRIFMIAVSERRAMDASRSSDPLRYANHSCAPNMVLRVQGGRVELYALTPVGTGEELTVNYGPTHHAGRLACRCNRVGCKRQI